MIKDNYRVKSLSAFIAAVNEIQDAWSDKDDDYIYPWFRGHSNCDHQLLPGLYRNKNDIDNEDSYRDDFAQKAYPFLADSTYGVPASDWEWYFLMQHYGLPTRLLDWSKGCLIALHFALFFKSGSDDSDPCVWVLNPFELSRLWKQQPVIYLFSDEEVKEYLPVVWSHDRPPKKPVVITPVYKSKRIAVQKGVFTIHGTEATPLEDIEAVKPWLVKIIINYREIDLIKAELQMTGVTQSTLFPELAGLAQELKEYWRNE